MAAFRPTSLEDALKCIEFASRRIHRVGRTPDMWELDRVSCAWNALWGGMFTLAVTEARVALTPPTERAKGWQNGMYRWI